MRPPTSPRPGASAGPRSVLRPGPSRPSPVHLHRFRRTGDDPFSSASLYACRCGVVRAGM